MKNWNSELKKCLLDKSRKYMIEKYIFPDGLWKRQSKVLEKITDQDLTLVIKSRAVGFTDLIAAFTACEMVLNGDSNMGVVYMCQNRMSGDFFIRNVAKYIQKIPKELWCMTIEEGALYNVITNATLYFGNAKLSYSTNDRISHKPTYIIYDEPVTCRDKYDIECSLMNLKSAWGGEMKVIVGGCGNHRNTKWFDFVKKYKNTGSYIEMPWWTNPNNKVNEEDQVIVMTDANNEVQYYSNKWYRERKMMYGFNEDDFDDEFECKVWKYKTEKEFA